MFCVRRIRSLLVPIFALAAGFAPASSFAQAEQWDQARVTEIAQELAGAVKDLREAVRREVPSTPGRLQQGRAQYALSDALRLLKSETRYLAAQLKDGKGRDETFLVYKRIDSLRQQAAENARKMMILQPTLDRIDAARKIWVQLVPYYGEEAGA